MKLQKHSSVIPVTVQQPVRSFRQKQHTGRPRLRGIGAKKGVSGKLMLGVKGTTCERWRKEEESFGFEEKVIKEKRGVGKGRRNLMVRRKENKPSSGIFTGDADREEIFLPYNQTFQLRDYLEYESEEENYKEGLEEEMILENMVSSPWTKIYTSIMEKPYFLKRLKNINSLNTSRSKRKERIEQKFQEIITKSLPRKKEEINNDSNNPQNPLQTELKTLKLKNLKNLKSLKTKALSPRKKGLTVKKNLRLKEKVKGGETERKGKRGLRAFGEGRRSIYKPKNTKIKKRMDNILIYSRKAKNTPMANLINLSCSSSSHRNLRKRDNSGTLYDRLREWVKDSSKSRSHRPSKSYDMMI